MGGACPPPVSVVLSPVRSGIEADPSLKLSSGGGTEAVFLTANVPPLALKGLRGMVIETLPVSQYA